LFSIFEPFFIFKAQKTIEIEEGLTTKEIASVLKDNGILFESYSFIFWANVSGNDGKLKSGIYDLPPVNNVFALFDLLSKGGRPKEIQITIPEGFTAKDIAERLYENGIVEDETGCYNYLKPFEGYLYPDTYNFYLKMSFGDIVSKMRSRFYEVVPADYTGLAKKKNLTFGDAIILASIVEKEAKFDADRPLVASVFLNRIATGMPLQADSTILYALGVHKEWLSPEDYEVDSPYNTYKNTSLPPTPIWNPGIKSIMAVVEATKTDYYYFMTTPEGKAVFAKTLAEHEANLRKYYGRN
jgi:UPF0755 protein